MMKMMKKICHSSVGQGYSNTKGPADLWTLNPLAGQTNSNVHDDEDDDDDDDDGDVDDDDDDEGVYLFYEQFCSATAGLGIQFVLS